MPTLSPVINICSLSCTLMLSSPFMAAVGYCSWLYPMIRDTKHFLSISCFWKHPWCFHIITPWDLFSKKCKRPLLGHASDTCVNRFSRAALSMVPCGVKLLSSSRLLTTLGVFPYCALGKEMSLTDAACTSLFGGTRHCCSVPVQVTSSGTAGTLGAWFLQAWTGEQQRDYRLAQVLLCIGN